MREMLLCAVGIMLLGINFQACSLSSAGTGESHQLYCICGDKLVPLLDEECELAGLDPKTYSSAKSSFDQLCMQTYDASCRATTEGELKKDQSSRP